MFGPVGADGAAGGAPRSAGTNGQSRAELSVSQPHPLTIVFSAASVLRTAPVATSATYRSILVSRVSVKASRLPSGEKPMRAMCASGGAWMVRSAALATVRNVMPVPPGRPRGPLLAGSMREPARPIHGRASSAIDGIDLRGTSAMTSRVGLSATPGEGAASMMSTMG